MNEKTRTRTAWALLLVLSPVLALTVWDAATKIQERKQRAGGTTPAAVESVAPSGPTAAENEPGLASSSDAASAPDPRVVEEQEKLAATIPTRNPFDAGEPEAAPATKPVRPVNPDRLRIKFSGFVLNKQSGKRLAIVNGQLLGEGDSLQGWTIGKIACDSILLADGTNTLVVEKK
ncbi:MAG: hypothetical protein QME60_03700 [Verrucomicrobiota bacterium]|nr:hypothetical protein [Verrucomicrobiota bacterium]